MRSSGSIWPTTPSHTHTRARACAHTQQPFPVPSAWIRSDPVNSLLILFSHSEAAGNSRVCNRKWVKLRFVSSNFPFRSQRGVEKARTRGRGEARLVPCWRGGEVVCLSGGVSSFRKCFRRRTSNGKAKQAAAPGLGRPQGTFHGLHRSSCA